jgi:hypothetical protein
VLTEREERMLTILRRLSHWNTQPLEDHPVNVLKDIVHDADEMLREIEKATAQANDASSGTPAPSKIQPPGAR